MTMFLYSGFYTRAFVEHNPRHIFVFGDNAERVGMGGQAIIRGLPNTIGIATKRSCGEFFESGNLADMRTIVEDAMKVETLVATKQNVVMPILVNGKTSLGCGLAKLPELCPDLYGFLDAWFTRMKREYASVVC